MRNNGVPLGGKLSTSLRCMATAKEAGQGGRVAPAEPDTLVETGAGITLLKSDIRALPPGLKQGGPPSKAKYYSVTDSEPVP